LLPALQYESVVAVIASLSLSCDCWYHLSVRLEPQQEFITAVQALLVYPTAAVRFAVLLYPVSRQARVISHMACSVKLYPAWSGWLMVHRRLRKHNALLLTCPPVQYRWDLLRVYHDALGHCGVNQLLAGPLGLSYRPSID
jgi:hypothetical protein